jgi:hypothetical protein
MTTAPPGPDAAARALTAALVLAVTAPTDEQAQRAVELVDRIAAGLDAFTIERCKRDAERELGTS